MCVAYDISGFSCHVGGQHHRISLPLSPDFFWRGQGCDFAWRSLLVISHMRSRGNPRSRDTTEFVAAISGWGGD